MQSEFGALFREQRLALGLSLRDLERRSGIHRGRLSLFEAGINQPSLSACERLAPVLGVSVADLALAAGHHNPGLPSLQPYLRQAYGLDEAGAADVEHYIRARYGEPTAPLPGEDEQPEDELSRQRRE